MQDVKPVAPAQHVPAHRYTNPLIVFAVLTIATVIEVALAIVPGIPHQSVVPVLLALSFVKASLVALYYMHLRYEKPIYGLIFVTPAAFAVFLIVVLLT
ncbi:MAG: cytochrome C oxidase subunit IV family protein [Anaerolineae bacterium]|nr:cytochrome C oxidase subunit IV family protein [Thermoflexales bacterium]MDW8406568.1 cytochrome C oxidase subunit IV family protein [Anaerolineae bacterium]